MENSTEIKVDSVKAINPTSVKVTFNQEVEALAKADVTVTNKDNNKVLVKAVTLAEDKKSATVEFYDALTKGEYKVAVTDAGEATLTYELGAVATIVADTTQTFAIGTGTKKLAYKFLDANGVDITSTIPASDVTVQANDDVFVGANGNVGITAEKSTFAYVVYKAGTADEVKSSRITVKVEASNLVEIVDYTTGTPNFGNDDYKQETTVNLGESATLTVQVKDQFGDKTTTPVTAEFESLDLDVAIVDKTTGAITPIKEGKFAVKISVGDLTKTVELEVLAQSKVTSISIDKTELTLSNKVTTATPVKFEVKNQFDKAVSSAVTADATTQAGKDLVTVTVAGDKINVTPKTGVKSGTATIEVKSVAEPTVKTTFTVTITEASEIDGYVVNGFESTLDLYAENEAETPKEMTVTVVPVDANGVATADKASNVSYVVTELDKDGKAVTDSTSAPAIQSALNANSNAGVLNVTSTANVTKGTYKVEIKVGAVVEATETLTIVDTAPQPELEFTATTVTNSDDKNVFDEITAKLKATLGEEEYTTTASDPNKLTVQEINYKTTDSTIIEAGKATNTITVKEDGVVDLLIGEVKIVVDNKPYTIDMNNFKLTVSSDAEKVAAEAALADFLDNATAYTWPEATDSPAIGNYAKLDALKVDGTTVTADLSGNTTLVQSIMKKPNIGTAIGKEATFENVSNYYVMNTVSRYLAALHRTAATPVDTIVYDGVTYSWNSESDNGKGSKWVTANGPSLVAAIVADNAEGISSVEFTLVDENENSIDVTLEVTAPLAPVEEL